MGPRGASVVAIALGALVIVVAVRVISRQLAVLTAATTRTLLERSSGASDALGLLSGALITMAVSSSSVTVSSLLPFAATKSLRYREVLPVILGANVGTTLTALLTALAVPGSMGSIAVQAALIHVAFNVISALLVLLIPPLRTLILWMGQVSGRVAARGYTLAAAVLAASYLVLPLAVILGYTLVT
ncbi:Na/Pi symporter [Corynebacterium suedekumii]|uniref:Na/Pi symporter n=1 Tax=Corynebacterium suedekumii TaxID=3049801 RepID=A0ABY8VM51_9CORY|nr:Na/Pi symporter [Corynebacterium suedekumii]WIM70719.1 Na/Pi symporter [Corynebacterium suedekumii]